MSKRIAPIHWKIFECVILAHGFKCVRHKGSHRSYTKPGVLRPVVIPTYDKLTPFLIKTNLKTAGISRDLYFKYLKDC
ncbi:MAG: type II toxin-antitoxin system HicA family toxin [Deltaproteobacteria bacterium]|jgi:predicted RNA binding protein YcfA (HicA-like mRNA interferase family)|nr:MAG: type II toxin-antitoxin system HicA family toxin [Deltaproteobacteria bacterium]